MKRLLCVIAVVCACVGFRGAPASGTTGTGSVDIVPADGLVDQQYVDVRFTGQPAGEDVRLRQCPKKATKVTQCKQDSASMNESGDSRLARVTSNGSGSASFVIRAGKIAPIKGTAFFCDFKHACEVDVFRIDQNTGADLGFDQAVRGVVAYAPSTVPCPTPPKSDPKRVAGAGGTTPAAAVIQWQAEACVKPLSLDVSFSQQNSPNAKASFVNGLSDSDFAASAMPLTDAEKGQLTDAAREAVQVPVTVGSLSFIYNYWEDFDRCDTDATKQRVTDLRMSPATLAGVMTGRIGSMADAAIAADNPDLVAKSRVKDDGGNCVASSTLPPRLINPVARADNSAATYVLTSWFHATAKDAWEAAGPEFTGGPTTIFPAGNGVDLRTGSASVARQVRSWPGGQGTGDIPDAAWIGYVDTSVARLVSLPSVAVRNGAGSFVAPSTDSVTAALQAATINDDGTVSANYAATAPSNLYPLLTVSYIITDKNKLTTPQATTMKAFLAYAVTKGQDNAEERGYVPLPDDMRTSADTNIKSIVGVGGESEGGKGGGGGAGDGATAGSTDKAGSSSSDGATDAAAAAASDPASVDNLFTSGAGAGSIDALAASIRASPVKGSLISQILGAAGGPAGIVRALTVFLGLPTLILLGFVCLFVGPGLDLVRKYRPQVARMFRWRTA